MERDTLTRLIHVSHGEYEISTDHSRLDHDAIAGFLAQSYWAADRTRDVMDRSIENSLCFGLYRTGNAASSAQQVGFARVVTDRATFAWLCDVFVAEEARGKGLGKWLIETVCAHPDLQGLRRWTLATGDAHEFYRPFGFVELSAPARWMEKRMF